MCGDSLSRGKEEIENSSMQNLKSYVIYTYAYNILTI